MAISYDVDELSVREMREELVIRALEHVKRQAEDHVRSSTAFRNVFARADSWLIG